MRDFTGLLKLAGIVKESAGVPMDLLRKLVAGGKSVMSGVSRAGKYVSVPGTQEYMSHSQFKRLMRRVASMRREYAASNGAKTIDQVIRGRDMAYGRAQAAARRSMDASARNLSALTGNGFSRVGTTYSGYDIYDMPFSDNARTSLRKLVDAQYGTSKNPWCIIERKGPVNSSGLGMTRSSYANWVSEMERPESGRFRVAVDPKTNKLVAIESAQVGSPKYPAWHSMSNHPAATISDAASLKGSDPSTWHKNKHKVLLGYETGQDGVLYPTFNPGPRASGERIPLSQWRSADAIDTGVEIL